MKKKNDNMLPFTNAVQKAKTEFKQMIDKMGKEEFYAFLFFVETIMNEAIDEDFIDELDEDWEDSENCDCEACQQVLDDFSGEMINFKCTECNKFSTLPIEIVNEIYEENHKPLSNCFLCGKEVSPTYYVAPDGKIFKK